MATILDEIIPLFGQALENEDRCVLGGASLRKTHGGILRVLNERYYQFTCWRTAMSRWDATVETAIDGRQVDLVLATNGGRTAIEMKVWKSDSGERELPKIQDDIGRLMHMDVLNGCMMLFSANPPAITRENFDWLGERIRELANAPMRHYGFLTVNPRGEEFEFWVAGWLVKTSRGLGPR